MIATVVIRPFGQAGMSVTHLTRQELEVKALFPMIIEVVRPLMYIARADRSSNTHLDDIIVLLEQERPKDVGMNLPDLWVTIAVPAGYLESGEASDWRESITENFCRHIWGRLPDSRIFIEFEFSDWNSASAQTKASSADNA